jgi:hypothetical protein
VLEVPGRKEMFMDVAYVAVPARPEIVSEGEHAGNRGTVLISAMVRVFESQGKGELWAINV